MYLVLVKNHYQKLPATLKATNMKTNTEINLYSFLKTKKAPETGAFPFPGHTPGSFVTDY
jgi:hypothetical protein